MKIYISVDMEGVAAVATRDQVTRGGSGYPRAQALMTAETNAAVAGAFDAGATEVLVNDSHGPMDNLLHTELDPRARVVVGKPKTHGMVEGLAPDYDAALFIGYHGAAGSRGVLAHTFSGHFARVRLDGHDVSEADVNALYAASRGVPVAFLSGDDVICDTTSRLLPDTRKLAVKTTAGWTATTSFHPAEACRLIHAGVAESLTDRAGIGRPVVPTTMVLEVELAHPAMAELAALMPGMERVDATTVRHEISQVETVMGVITVLYTLAAYVTLSSRPPQHR